MRNCAICSSESASYGYKTENYKRNSPCTTQHQAKLEPKELQRILGVPNDMVYLMPEGLERQQLNERRKWLTELCVREGYNFTDRLHIITYGDERGV